MKIRLKEQYEFETGSQANAGQQWISMQNLQKKLAKVIIFSEFTVSGDDDILGKSLLLMRDNLLMNNKKEAEQNWIAEGKEEISNILRLHNKINELAYDVIVKLINYINAIQGAFYVYDDEKNKIINVANLCI